jgi:8-oxo-dGTP pyrophosphatase MutT (NUDIX family)
VGSFEVLFLQRADTVVHHKSQIAFPGGRVEPSEGVLGDAFVCAALRETYEEVGIPSELVRVLGVLPELRTVTGFLITPVVGMLECAIEDVPLRIDSNEVAEAFWLSLVGLEHPQTYRLEYFLAGETRYPTHCFRLGDRKIWGITATILKNLLDRLAQVQ